MYSNKRLIEFKYVLRDGIVSEEKTTHLYTDTIRVLGVQTRRVQCDRGREPQNLTALFITSGEVEYATISMTADELIAQLNPCKTVTQPKGLFSALFNALFK